MPIPEDRVGNQAAPYGNRSEIVGAFGVGSLKARMPSIGPYGSNRALGLVRIRHLAGQDEALIRCMAQQKVSRSRIVRPIVATFRKDMVTEPPQVNERARALDFLEFNKDLTDRGVRIEYVSAPVEAAHIAFVPVVVHGALESDYHLAALGIKITGISVCSNLSTVVLVANGYLGTAVAHGQMPQPL